MSTDNKQIRKIITANIEKIITEYNRVNNIKQYGAVKVYFDQDQDLYLITFEDVIFKFKNRFKNLFNKINHKKLIKNAIKSFLNQFTFEQYKPVIVSSKSDMIKFYMISNVTQFVIYNFQKVFKELEKIIKSDDSFICYAGNPDKNNINIIVQYKRRLAFSINLTISKMIIKCFESGEIPKPDKVIISHPFPCATRYDDIISFYLKQLKIYLNEVKSYYLI